METAKSSSLEFDYQRDEEDSFGRVTAVKLSPEMHFVADQALDFAVVGLAADLKERPVIPLVDDGNTTPGERVSLYHHPQGGPLRLSLCGGTVVAVNENFVRHDASTWPGSAGAPLLDQNLRLIGVHHASAARNFGTVNEAIRATAILALLARREPILAAELNVVGHSDALRPPVRAAVQSEAPSAPVAIHPLSASAALHSSWSPAADQPPSASAATPEVVEARASPARDSVFISYARADQGKRKWRERLRTFLSPFGEELDVWDDSRIETGAEWRTEIDIALKRARVAVLLIGPSFLGSQFITKNELPPLLTAADAEGVVILPLITNHCSYERTQLGKYQAFNDPKKPLEALDLPEQNRWLQRFAERIDEAFHKSGRN